MDRTRRPLQLPAPLDVPKLPRLEVRHRCRRGLLLEARHPEYAECELRDPSLGVTAPGRPPAWLASCEFDLGPAEYSSFVSIRHARPLSGEHSNPAAHAGRFDERHAVEHGYGDVGLVGGAMADHSVTSGPVHCPGPAGTSYTRAGWNSHGYCSLTQIERSSGSQRKPFLVSDNQLRTPCIESGS